MADQQKEGPAPVAGELPTSPEKQHESACETGEPTDAEKRREELAATVAVRPELRHARIGAEYASRSTGWPLDEMAMVAAYQDATRDVRKRDLAIASNVLTSQALTLDAVFTEMLTRSNLNLRDYPEAAERYMRMAMKAQAQSRATIEALARLHQPREQIVKHVTVQEGGQAVVAENFHHHQNGGRNGKTEDQPHDQSPSGSALPGPQPLGHPVSVPGDEGEEAVSPARRQIDRSAKGQQECA